MQRYPLVVMPTMGDLSPPHNLDTTREGAARVLDALRVSLIAPVLGIPALAVPIGNPADCVREFRSSLRVSGRICALMPAR
jgi:hypothetical protein